jgi:hypothetical protein
VSVEHSIPSCSLHESLQRSRGLGFIHYGDQEYYQFGKIGIGFVSDSTVGVNVLQACHYFVNKARI